ncbi:MAG: type II secretion system protein [Kiritimatiellia bacterium]|nr:type II secretion system protein [Kiritimatiellia bacterium]
MKTNRSSDLNRSFPRGFTLIEMLVVMGIIGLLMGLLFPTIGAVRHAANKARAEQEIKSIETAILNYLTDYGKFPLQTDGNQDRAYIDDQYIRLIQTLRADPAFTDLNLWNPRRAVYIELAEQAVVAGRLKDPWGNDYRVAGDLDFNKQVDSSVMNGYGTLSNRQVAAWSFGRDGLSGADAGHRKDDVISWAP